MRFQLSLSIAALFSCTSMKGNKKYLTENLKLTSYPVSPLPPLSQSPTPPLYPWLLQASPSLSRLPSALPALYLSIILCYSCLSLPLPPPSLAPFASLPFPPLSQSPAPPLYLWLLLFYHSCLLPFLLYTCL